MTLAAQTLPGAMVAMERLRNSVEQLAISHEASRAGDVMTISVGVAAWSYEDMDTPTTVLDRADAALYRSKAAGRNRVTSDQPEHQPDPC